MRVVYILSLVLIHNIAYASKLQLEDYIAKYLQVDENLGVSAAEFKQADNQFQVSADLWRPSLSLDLSQSQTEELQTTLDEENSSDLSLSISQDLPYGLNSTITVSNQLSDDNEANADTYNSYSFRLSEDIWRNAFGRGEQFQKKRDFELKNAAELEYAWQRLNSCQAGTKIFIEAYSAQEEIKIYQDIVEQSEKALRLARRARRQRLMRKIDLLSAEADYLKVKSFLAAAEEEKNRKYFSLNTYAGMQQFERELVRPKFIIDLQSFGDFDVLTNLQHKSYSRQAKAKYYNRDYVKDKIRGEAAIAFEVGRSKGQLSSTVDNDYDYATVSLSFELPAFQENLDATYKIADYEWQKYELQQKQVSKDLKAQYTESLESLKSNSKRLEINKEKQNIYAKQVKEAYRLLGAGKMEFEDYILFRDLFLNEKLNQISIEKNIWFAVIELWKLHNEKTKVCWGQG